MNVGPYRKLTVLLLCCLGIFGIAGVHRLYTRNIGTGILWLCTGGLFGLGTLVDLISIADGTYRDGDGYFLKPQ